VNVAKNSTTAGNIPLSVLVVDDEMLIRWSISEALMATGHNVVEAGSAQGALEALASTREPIDVVLLDYRLPDSNGLGLLATIRQTLPESAVVLMTAYGTPEVTRDALSLGVYRVLDKPFDMHGVDSLVRNAYAASRR
jgi:DNA-binding NtrC family response regulator